MRQEKLFINQDSDFKATIRLKIEKGNYAAFGLEGFDNLIFEIKNNRVEVKGLLISSLEESGEIDFNIIFCDKLGIIYENNFPIFYFNIENGGFDKAFCDSESNFTFSATVEGLTPNISIESYFFEENELNIKLKSDTIHQINILEVLPDLDSFKFIEEDLSFINTHEIKFLYTSSANLENEEFKFKVKTNFKNYDFSIKIDHTFVKEKQEIIFESKGIPSFPLSFCDFYIKNPNDFEETVSFKLDVFGYDEEKLYVYKEILAEAKFEKMIEGEIIGGTSFVFDYDADFSGYLNGKKYTQKVAGRKDVFVKANGVAKIEYQIPVYAKILGKTYESKASGAYISRNSDENGYCQIEETIEVSGVQEAIGEDGEIIFPDHSIVFAGKLKITQPIIEKAILPKKFTLQEIIKVKEKKIKIEDIWKLECFGELNKEKEYIIPPGSTISGKLIFDSNQLNYFPSSVKISIIQKNNLINYIDFSL